MYRPTSVRSTRYRGPRRPPLTAIVPYRPAYSRTHLAEIRQAHLVANRGPLPVGVVVSPVMVIFIAVVLVIGLLMVVSTAPSAVAEKGSSIAKNPTLPAAFGQNTVQGSPTITERRLEKVLCFAGSPACDKAQVLYDEGVAANINPAYALGFFHHESNYGKQGMAAITHSLGNIRCTAGVACYEVNGGYAQYNSWEDGFQAWYDLINNLYIKQWKANTLEKIIPHYAPSDDGNDEKAYIDAVETDVRSWREVVQKSRTITAGLAVHRLDQNSVWQYDNQQQFNDWSPSACSAASTAAVLNFYGKRYQIADVLDEMIHLNLIDQHLGLLEHAGLRSIADRYQFNALLNESDNLDNVITVANSGHPVIVNWPPGKFFGGHFLVVTGGDASNVLLADSSSYNYRVLSRDKFLSYWAGFSAVITPK
jgi:hypothetical protein